MTSGDFQAAGETQTEKKKKKKKRGEWAPLTVLVWSSVTVHTAGRNKEHADKDVTQNNSL